MLADALLRSMTGTTALLRVTGTNLETKQSEVGLVATTFAEAYSPHTWDTPFIFGVAGVLLIAIVAFF